MKINYCLQIFFIKDSQLSFLKKRMWLPDIYFLNFLNNSLEDDKSVGGK